MKVNKLIARLERDKRNTPTTDYKYEPLVEIIETLKTLQKEAEGWKEAFFRLDKATEKPSIPPRNKKFPSLNAGDVVYVREFAGEGDFKGFKVTSVNYRQSESETEIWYNAKMLNSSWDCNCTFGEKNIGDTVFLTYKEANNVMEREKNNGK